MRCPITRLAAAYPDLPSELEAHVSGCAACRERWEGYREVADLVAGLPPEREPSQLQHVCARRALLARAGARAQPARPDHRAWRRLSGLAATATLLVVSGSVLRSHVELGPRDDELALEPRAVDGVRSTPEARVPPSPSFPPPLAPEGPADAAASPGPTCRAAPGDPSNCRSEGSRRHFAESWAGPAPSHAPRRAPIPPGPTLGDPQPDRAGSPDERDGILRRGGGKVGSTSGAGAWSSSGRRPDGRGSEPRAGSPQGPPRTSASLARETDDVGPGGAENADSGCAHRLNDAFDRCLADHGLTVEQIDNGEENDIVSICFSDASGAFDLCCAETPDESCADAEYGAVDPPLMYCADVLFATNDQCLLDHGLDPYGEYSSDSDIDIIAICWSDVANGAFDVCCAENPDATCNP